MNDDKKIMDVFAQAYQLIAKASKQEPSKEGFQQILEILGEDGIKQCVEVVDDGPEAVAKAMIQIIQEKSARKAANGAKLQYLRQLKGLCPEGYLKHGGRCKPCEKQAGVFNNKADLFNKGGNVTPNKDQEKTPVQKQRSGKNVDNQNKKLPKFGQPRENQDNRRIYDEVKDKQRKDMLAERQNGGTLNDSPESFNKLRSLLNQYNRRNTQAESRLQDNNLRQISNPSEYQLERQHNGYKRLPSYGQADNYPGATVDYYPYKITREIIEPQLPPPFMPGIQGVQNTKLFTTRPAVRFQTGGSINDYRNQHRRLAEQSQQMAMTTQEGVPVKRGSMYVLQGTRKAPIMLEPVVVTGRPTYSNEYHVQRGKNGEQHEWIAPQGSPSDINLSNPATFVGPYRYTDSRGAVTYKQYVSPDRMVTINPRTGERQFNRERQRSVPAKKQRGGSILNRIWGNISGEGVNGEGTRFNPVQLNNVDVYGFNRNSGDLRHTRISSTYTQSPGYRKQSDYLQYPNGQFFERSIDFTPNGNDTTYSTWHQPYDPRYDNVELMRGSNFDRQIEAASSHDIRNGVVKSIPFFRGTKHLRGEHYSK